MSKETTEFFSFLAKVVNSTVISTADDDFNFQEDFGNYIDDLVAAPTAIQGFNLIDDEGRVLTNEQKNEIFRTTLLELTGLTPEDASDFNDFIKGVYSVARFFLRKGYQKGIEDVKTGKVPGVEVTILE